MVWITSNAYNTNRIYNVFWGGTKYAVNDKLDLIGAVYYGEQNNFSTTPCTGVGIHTSSASCAGTFDAFSFMIDNGRRYWRRCVGGRQRQDNRRLAGIAGRIDPGVYAGGRVLGGVQAPVEGGDETSVFFRPGHEGGGGKGEHDQSAQGVTVHDPKLWRGPDRPQARGVFFRTAQMKPP